MKKSSETYIHHRPVRYKFKRNKFITKVIDHIWHVDLADVSNLKNKKIGQWFSFLFVCIDALSKFAWVVPIPQKKAEQTAQALQSVVKSYNNSFHRSIGITPSDVNKSNESKVPSRLYGDILSVDNPIIFNFNIGDYVRIPIGKKLFDKGYTQKWSSDIYVVIQKIPTNPPKYTIKALTSEENIKQFYELQLQKV